MVLDKFFNPKILEIFIPIAISMFLASSISFIDSTMVANYSTISLSAINIANQIKFIFGPMYFGILSGLSIYTAQAIGNGNKKRVSNIFGFGLVLILTLSLINFAAVLLFSRQIISFFAPVTSTVGEEALLYLRITVINTVFWPISMLFMYQFRSIKKPKVPLYINTAMLATNTILNALLIYGVGPIPELGVAGAGIGTIFSVGIFINVYVIVAIRTKAEFLAPPKGMFDFQLCLAKDIIMSTLPLILIELLFGIANVIYTKIYVTVGIEAFTLVAISKNITNLVNAGVIATAQAAGILLGETIGSAGDVKSVLKELFKFMRKMSIVIIVLIAFILPILIPLYKPNDIVISNFMVKVYVLMIINGVYMMLRVYSSTLISILKSGGNTKAVVFADPVSSYLIGIPLTLVCVLIFNANIIVLRIAWISEIVGKLIISYYLFKQNNWMRKL